MLRSNKQIERKMVFDCMAQFKDELSFRHHRYIGFGSIWFVDFIFAHKVLKIKDMVSIESTEFADRAEFNKPYSTIEVRPGLSTDVISEMGAGEWARPQIVWLDYDGLLEKIVTDDLDMLVRRLAANSVLLITVNANRQYYRRVGLRESNPKTAFRRVEEILGKEVLSERFNLSPDHYPDIADHEFAAFLADAILNYLRRKLRTSGRQEGAAAVSFVPTFNFCHVDGAEMITVGGIFVPSDKCAVIEEKLIGSGIEFSNDQNPVQTVLDLIPLTLKEKMTMDRLLPFRESGFESKAKGAGLRLPPGQVEKYRDHYLYFPVYVESLF